MNSTLERIRRIQEVLDEKAYLQHGAKLPLWRRVAHFWVRVARSFQRNRGPMRAASLAYTTILALIPVLALVVSVSTNLLKNEEAINFLLNKFITTVAPQLDLVPNPNEAEAVANRDLVVEKIRSYIETVNSGTLGLTAGLLLVFIAISVLSTVETTFNDMWGVTRGRTWSARIVQYWAAITLGPLFLLTAMALTTSTQIGSGEKSGARAAANRLAIETNVPSIARPASPTPERAGPGAARTAARVKEQNLFARIVTALSAVPVLTTLLSFVVLSVFLTLVYRLMPNTKVRWDAAAIGGLCGGGLLQLNNLFNVIYISRVVTYSKIYGGLGAVPIFLLGLYFSWIIVLFGAQVAYAYQNRQAYVQEKQAESVNQRGREFVALRLMAHAARKFYLGEKPPSRLEMANSLAIPSQLVSQVLGSLTNAKLLMEVAGEETGYAPARPLDKITVEDVLRALREGQGNELATADDPSRAVLREEFERVALAEMHAAGSVTLQNLVVRLASLPAPERAMAVESSEAAPRAARSV